MTKYAFGVDVGGTTVKMGFFTSTGELITKWEIPTDTTENGKYILSDIAASIREQLAIDHVSAEDVIGIGIGVPGPVDTRGYILNCVNLGWGTFDLEAEMFKLTGIRCRAGNDANVAALGEMYRGCAAAFRNVVMLTLGTGVGGGIILNGEILPGTFGAAGEIGHMKMRTDEPAACGCGNHGCLEQYASANGISRVAKLRLEESDEDSVLRKCDDVSAKDIFDAAKAGDALAMELAEEMGDILGKACANIAVVVDPEAFVFGGGVSRAGKIVTDLVEKYYNKYAFRTGAKFLLAELGNDAGIYGSVKLALEGTH